MIRSVLEGLAASLACKRITENKINKLKEIIKQSEEAMKCGELEEDAILRREFHQLIVDIVQMEPLKEMILKLRDRCQIFERKLTNKLQEKEAYVEHKEIVKAIVTGNSSKTEQLMREHILNTKKMVSKNL